MAEGWPMVPLQMPAVSTPPRPVSTLLEAPVQRQIVAGARYAVSSSTHAV
jgi:hypothetical protein